MSELPSLDLDASPNAETARLLRRLAREDAGQPDWLHLSAKEGRAQAEATNRRWNSDLPPMARIERLTVPADTTLGTPALPCQLFVPQGAKGVLLYLHGGGWAFCSLATHERAMRLLALACGMAVLGPEYRLAPEHPFPAPLHDTLAAWRALGQGLAGPGPYAMAGDSAGANLALAAMLHEQVESRPQPHLAMLYYGVYAYGRETPSHQAYGRGFGLSSDRMECYWEWYVPDVAQRSLPFASPLKAADQALAGLPPLWLNAAELDPLASDTLLLGERLRRLGRDDPVILHRGVLHGFMQQAAHVAEGRRAFTLSGQWAREQLAAVD